jgi:hypothetical protein
MIQSITIRIKGISPLLMCRFPMEPVEGISKMSKEMQAEQSAYRIPDSKELYIPGTAVQKCITSAAAYSKGKGRGTLEKVAGASVMVKEEYCKLGTIRYEIDSRAVVNPMTRGRVIAHRPRLNEWGIDFTLEFDNTLLSEPQLRRIVDDAGKLTGLLSFRPAKKGPYGKFMITSWEASL